jgi:hypothetical protein
MNTTEEMYFICSPCRDVITGKFGALWIIKSVQETVKRGFEPEAEEWPLLEPLPGNV